MTALSDWLQLMLAEMARKREGVESAHAEEARRAGEQRSEPLGPQAPPAAPQNVATRQNKSRQS